MFQQEITNFKYKNRKEVSKIRQQWKSITNVILEGREDLILKTLFAATRQLMIIYNKVDVDIPILHVMWLDSIIKKIESNDLSLFYFMAFTVLIIYISK